MTRLEIVTDFIRLSGRRDLVVNTTAYADAGVDALLNAACQRLEARQESPNSHRSWMFSLAAGEYKKTVTDLINIEQVWVWDSSETARYELDRAEEHRDVLAFYSDAGLADLDTGAPNVWAPLRHKLAPTHDGDTSGDFDTANIEDYDEIEFGTDETKRGILIMPPADQAYTVRVIGRFFPKTLTADADLNWWTVHWPLTVTYQMLELLEIRYRNAAGAAEWAAAVARDLALIRNEVITSTYAEDEPLQMGG